MIIKSLELKNFRNYQALGIAFDAGTNILYGDNAQGKTNVRNPCMSAEPQSPTKAARTRK